MASKNCTLSKGVTQRNAYFHCAMFTLFTTFPQVAQCLETLSTTHTQIYVGVVLPAAPNGHKIMVLSDWKTKLLANHHKGTL
jgi:hypothetical protein